MLNARVLLRTGNSHAQSLSVPALFASSACEIANALESVTASPGRSSSSAGKLTKKRPIASPRKELPGKRPRVKRGVAKDYLRTWQAMSQAEREAAGGAAGYAAMHGINPHTWASLASNQGLKPKGESRVTETRAPTMDDLREWQGMSPAEREAAGWTAGYAKARGINQNTWANLASKQGLRLKGESILAETARAPTKDSLREWQAMSPAEREAAGGAMGYAAAHGIKQGTWAHLANNQGLTSKGKSRLTETRPPTKDDLREWQAMSPAEREAAGGATGYTVTRGINQSTWRNLANN